MIQADLNSIRSLLGGHLIGDSVYFDGVSIDTRSLRPGMLYVALKGKQFNGHDFVKEAFQKGAVAALVCETLETAPGPLLQVSDTLPALGLLGAFWRSQFSIPVAALTGSCGKTTTRVLLTSILNQTGRVLAPKKNFNNAIGLPLTLLDMNHAHTHAVLEMGTDGPGEIGYLMDVANPTVTAVLNVHPVHLKGLKDEAGIAEEKGAVYRKLDAAGCAVLNRMSPYCEQWEQSLNGAKTLNVGVPGSVVWVSSVQLNAEGELSFQLHIEEAAYPVQLKLLGTQFVENAVLAAGMAYAMGASPENIQKGLEAAETFERRLAWKAGREGIEILDDTYNANPHALQAALHVLQHRDAKRRFLVLGDMGDLAERAESAHQEAGQLAKTLGIDGIYGYGPLSRLACEAFGEPAQAFERQEDLLSLLQETLQPGDLVLVKGSSVMHMNRIVKALQDESL